MIDRNAESVIDKIRYRVDKGYAKYKTTTERSDLSMLEWLIHAQEEAMDLAIYLEKLIQLEMRKEDARKEV